MVKRRRFKSLFFKNPGEVAIIWFYIFCSFGVKHQVLKQSTNRANRVPYCADFSQSWIHKTKVLSSVFSVILMRFSIIQFATTRRLSFTGVIGRRLLSATRWQHGNLVTGLEQPKQNPITRSNEGL